MADGPADSMEAVHKRLEVAQEMARSAASAFGRAQAAAAKSGEFPKLDEKFGELAEMAGGLSDRIESYSSLMGHASGAARDIQDTVDLIMALQNSRDAANGFANNLDDPRAALKYARSTARLFGAAAPLVSKLPPPVGDFAGKLFEAVPAIVDGFLAITEYYITKVDAEAGIYDTSEGACWVGRTDKKPDRTGPDAQRYCADEGYRHAVDQAGLGSMD